MRLLLCFPQAPFWFIMNLTSTGIAASELIVQSAHTHIWLLGLKLAVSLPPVYIVFLTDVYNSQYSRQRLVLDAFGDLCYGIQLDETRTTKGNCY